MKNPFVTNGYVSPEYFCDREKETAKIVSLLTNENNIALISPRRLGKQTCCGIVLDSRKSRSITTLSSSIFMPQALYAIL